MIYNLVSNEFHNNMSYETTKGYQTWLTLTIQAAKTIPID